MLGARTPTLTNERQSVYAGCRYGVGGLTWVANSSSMPSLLMPCSLHSCAAAPRGGARQKGRGWLDFSVKFVACRRQLWPPVWGGGVQTCPPVVAWQAAAGVCAWGSIWGPALHAPRCSTHFLPKLAAHLVAALAYLQANDFARHGGFAGGALDHGEMGGVGSITGAGLTLPRPPRFR